jgi:hypothetical protein
MTTKKEPQKKVTPKKEPQKKVVQQKELQPKKKLAELEKKLQDPKYSGQAYKSDAKVEISGELFADFVNTRGNNENVLVQIKQYLESAVRVIDNLLLENDALTLRLMEQHIKNVDSGATYTVEQPAEKTQEDGENTDK